MNGFFAELRTRKVYRVAVAYAVAGWAIIQFGDIVFPVWDMPAWSLRLVISLVLAGFPIALIFAWVFDVTPEGLRATAPVLAAREERPHRTRRNIAILLAASVAVSVVAGLFLLPRASAGRIEKSIAVLPFENFSDEKENAHFADGIQDDILTSLSKIGDLKVISRTSVMGYRGKTHNVRQIGRELGVGAVLEGSVRRAGNRVRVNVQLINARTDEHMWSEIYDRDLTDVFSIQSELAQKIATALRAQLSPEEQVQMSRKPTENGEAYLAFVEAQNLHTNVLDHAKLLQAERLYERAIQLDPNFALATARLAHLQSWLYQSHDKTPARRQRARDLSQRALSLQPDLPEAHLALGYSYYYGDRDYDRALDQFAIAMRGLPNDASVYMATGAIQRRQGKWALCTASFERAAELSPRDVWVLQNLGITYEATRDFAAADKVYRRVVQIDPRAVSIYLLLSRLQVNWKGDIAGGEAVLAQVPAALQQDGQVVMGWVTARILQRRFDEALAMLDKLPAKEVESDLLKHDGHDIYHGMLLELKGDAAAARPFFEKARQELEAKIAALPDYAKFYASLGHVLAYLGDKAGAIAAADRSMQLLPESADAFDGPMLTVMAAQTLAVVGETDRALALVDHLLTIKSGLSVPLLRLDPMWDPLRNDPRFEQLLAKYAPRP
jgi:TolB-like protein/Tfp pilus assembly protein PilF